MPGLPMDDVSSSNITSPSSVDATTDNDEESVIDETTEKTTTDGEATENIMEKTTDAGEEEESSTSDVMSPNNSSTGIKNKKPMETPGSARRLSKRVKAQPDYYDSSPIPASLSSVRSVTPSPRLKSPLLNETNQDDDDDDDNESNEKTLVEDESEDVSETPAVFKKPPALKRRRSKTPLNVTTKKGKSASKNKSDISLSRLDSDESSLFEIVKSGKSAQISVINDWIESYIEDKVSAMRELIQFFVHCSGCNAEVTTAMINNEDTVQSIRHLTENFGESAEEYPLIITRPEYKKFKNSFSMFISQLINLCQHNIIYDEEMSEVLICWIIGLSDSQVRAFRHTSTFASMKIVSALIDVALKVGIELDNTQRQLDGENLKSANKRSRDKLEKLEKRREELRQNQAELEDMMNRIFTAIFMHRYRDTRSEIRSICISELGIWMEKYSTVFLHQNYLKYLGWMLYDKIGEVRLEVLKALQKLYSNEEFAENEDFNKLFTTRFKDRLIHMTLDVDLEVAVHAIKIATLLHKYDVLEEDDCSQVEQLVFCDQRRMAHAAGEFLTSRILRLSIEASPKKLKKHDKEEYLQQMNIKAILNFFIKTEIHDHCGYIVDSLWEHTELLKDWKTMNNLLLDSNALIELEDVEESALINLMCCACKQAATGLGPAGRNINKKQSTKEKKTLTEDKYNISDHFMQHLPSLIEKYKADVTKISELVQVPQYFDLEMYPEKRYTKQLESLLVHLEDIVEKHADTELLTSCSETYFYLLDNELTIKQTVEISRNRIFDKLVEKFRQSIQLGIPNAEDDKESESYFKTVTSLKRIKAFYANHDLRDWDIYSELHAIIDQGVNGSVDEEVLILAIQSMYYSFLMNLESLNVPDPDKDDMKLLRKRQKIFIKQLDELLQFSSLNIKTQVYKLLCDFFVFFSRQTANSSPKLAQIVQEASPLLQVRMRDFVISHVFNNLDEIRNDNDDEEDDNESEELQERRTLLSGFCKLIAYEMFDIKLAAPIYAQFLKSFAFYGDVIKALMKESKEGNVIAFSKTLLFALQQGFECMRDDNDGFINPKAEEFGSLKDLAHRFSLILGVDTKLDSTRKGAITIHRHGITYAFSYPLDPSESPSKQVIPEIPPNLLFLEILQEFTNRVHQTDKKLIVSHLEETGGELLNKTGHGWESIATYKNGIEIGIEETKTSEIAETELEADLAAIKKGKKKKSISFANDTKTVPMPNKKKAKKKLSMSKVGGANKWLSKQTIEDESERIITPKKTPKNTPKVARSIPKVTTARGRSKSPVKPKKRVSISPIKKNSPAKAKRTPSKSPTKSPAKLPVKSPKKPLKTTSSKKAIKSPAKKSPVKKVSNTPVKTKATASKKGSVANSPLRLSRNVNSPKQKGSNRKRRQNEEIADDIEEEEEEEEEEENEIEANDGDDDGSQGGGESSSQTSQSEISETQKTESTSASWLKPKISAKRPRKSYGGNKPAQSPLKRTRSLLDDSSQDSGSDVSRSDSPSARQMRASKRVKRDTSSEEVFDDSMSQSSSQQSEDITAE